MFLNNLEFMDVDFNWKDKAFSERVCTFVSYSQQVLWDELSAVVFTKSKIKLFFLLFLVISQQLLDQMLHQIIKLVSVTVSNRECLFQEIYFTSCSGEV